MGKPFDKSITIDNSNLNLIDFIDQSIEIDTHNHRFVDFIVFINDSVLLTLVNIKYRFFRDNV